MDNSLGTARFPTSAPTTPPSSASTAPSAHPSPALSTAYTHSVGATPQYRISITPTQTGGGGKKRTSSARSAHLPHDLQFLRTASRGPTPSNQRADKRAHRVFGGVLRAVERGGDGGLDGGGVARGAADEGGWCGAADEEVDDAPEGGVERGFGACEEGLAGLVDALCGFWFAAEERGRTRSRGAHVLEDANGARVATRRAVPTDEHADEIAQRAVDDALRAAERGRERGVHARAGAAGRAGGRAGRDGGGDGGGVARGALERGGGGEPEEGGGEEGGEAHVHLWGLKSGGKECGLRESGRGDEGRDGMGRGEGLTIIL
ncbi:hypothetical protein HWV62_5407 [Athelia sp. TMB]|nr:hypothetical protein HWV62_5407 [Athelia sp. TMB]